MLTLKPPPLKPPCCILDVGGCVVMERATSPTRRWASHFRLRLLTPPAVEACWTGFAGGFACTFCLEEMLALGLDLCFGVDLPGVPPEAALGLALPLKSEEKSTVAIF